MSDQWNIDGKTCTGCGICVNICPNRILQKTDEKQIVFQTDKLWTCFRCGHCMAVCPTSSINIPGLSYDSDFYIPPKLDEKAGISFDQLISSRRAIRNFQDRVVPLELLEKIVAAIQLAPPGFPPVKTEVTVIQDRKMLQQALPMMIRLYESLLKAMSNPIARQVVKRKVGKEKFITMKNHVVPLMTSRMPDLKSGKEDTIMRHAPALILLHADKNSENYMPDIYIALTFGFLAAHALGLGASAMDLIPPAVERSDELRKLFKIPAQNEVVGSLIIGYPKYRFQRAIHRELRSINWFLEEKQESNA